MNNDTRKLFSILSHAAIFFSWTIVSFGIPIVLFLISEDSVVKNNAKESLNFHLNVYIYGAIVAVLTALVITIPVAIVLGALLGIAIIVLPILAILKIASNPDTPYRYPFVFRVL
ncbi:hypothetical protein AY599_20675 [Leptolyngbya valderiana BDU 20041]|uniref:DUF4870 domain-containing protein n=1 Tax=Baaleninema simplex TaxID=2862350 RepID=UPI00034569CC|nr:DUF4870 domain-containing protein [Baaleninema simplex]MDC0833295.1 DUF4870 domain-containing protein [Geitlerinema sp. CS-897]OAB62664.1 hypothetical protein AY599_20675 [Leptolyngbya valderiana BDU 20041]PPT08576.1 hypothetical protein CKA32_005472 [Geitlerinema sp. FC II]